MKRLQVLGIGGILTAVASLMLIHGSRPEMTGSSGIARATPARSPETTDSGTVPNNVIARRLAGGKAADVDQWLSSLDPVARDEALMIMAAETAGSDPVRAEYDARRIIDPFLRREAVSLVLAYRFDQDPAAALATFRSESDPGLKSSIGARLLPALSNLDAPAAAGILAEDGMVDDNLTSLVASTVQRWAAQDAPAAAAWLAEIEDDSLRQAATTALVGEWGRRDVSNLENWLDNNPNAVEFQSAFADWRDPWTPQQWEDWGNQRNALQEGNLAEPYVSQCSGKEDAP